MPLHQITDTTFDTEVVKSAIPVLVDFSATWCGPCRALTPILKDMSDDPSLAGRITMVKVDVDTAKGVAARYGIAAIPAILLFKNGQPVERMIGLRPASDIRKAIERALA
jgi:thioredoxin 1